MEVTVTGVPNGTTVTLPGVTGPKVVQNGKVTLTNDDLPTTADETGKGIAQETGKLPTKGTSDITIPKKLDLNQLKDIAKKAVRKAAEEKIASINKIDLPEDKKEEFRKIVRELENYAKNKIDKAQTAEEITKAKDKGVKDIESIVPYGEQKKFKFTSDKEDFAILDLPELIITKWTDESGNELKPADAKAPAVLGEANEAYEYGEIEGYVFVRTDVNEEGDVVTHIFRKLTPIKPEGNGEQQGGDNKPQPTPEVPTDHTKPEVVTPDEQPAETENTTTKPKASQNILPNTGTAKGVGIFSAAAASILAGLGLIIPVKKEDEEEEETQNN